MTRSRPRITCPANVTVNANAGAMLRHGRRARHARHQRQLRDSDRDQQRPGAIPKGVTTVTWTAMDTSGNRPPVRRP